MVRKGCVHRHTRTQVQQDTSPAAIRRAETKDSVLETLSSIPRLQPKLCSSDPFLPSMKIFYFAFLKCQEKNKLIFPGLDLFHLESLHDQRLR